MLYKAADKMEQQLDEFARTLITEERKTLVESTGEVRCAVDIFRFYAGHGSTLGARTYVSAQPRNFTYSM